MKKISRQEADRIGRQLFGLLNGFSTFSNSEKEGLARCAALIQAGANVNATVEGVQGTTSLIRAVRRYDLLDAIPLLIKAGANLDAAMDDGNTALHVAVSQKKIPALEQLLAAGADIDIKNNKGESPLSLARAMDDQTLAQLFARTTTHRIEKAAHHGSPLKKRVPALPPIHKKPFLRTG